MFVKVCKQTIRISHVRISQKIKSALMWNLQYIIFIWRRRYWQIFAYCVNVLAVLLQNVPFHQTWTLIYWVEYSECKFYLYLRYLLLILFLHLFHTFQGHLLWCFFNFILLIHLFCTKCSFHVSLNIAHSFVFYSLTTFFWRNTLLRVTKSET